MYVEVLLVFIDATLVTGFFLLRRIILTLLQADLVEDRNNPIAIIFNIDL